MVQPTTHIVDPAQELARHAATYHRFMLGVKWVAIHFAAILAFLILAFATPAGIFAGLVAGAVILAIGVYAMTHGLAQSTEDEVLRRRPW